MEATDIQTAAIAAHDAHFNPKARWMAEGPNGLAVGEPLSKLGGGCPAGAYLVCAKRSDLRPGVWVVVAAWPGGSDGVEYVRWMLDAEAGYPHCFWGRYGRVSTAIQAFHERT